MTLKIQGSSIRKEFVHCACCNKPFSWLNGYTLTGVNPTKGIYVALCRKCRLTNNDDDIMCKIHKENHLDFRSIDEFKKHYFPKDYEKERIRKQELKKLKNRKKYVDLSEDASSMTPVYPGGQEAFWPRLM